MYLPASFLLLEASPQVSTCYQQSLATLKLQTNLKTVSGQDEIMRFFGAIGTDSDFLQEFDLILVDRDLDAQVLMQLRGLGCPESMIVMVAVGEAQINEVGSSFARLPFNIRTIVMLLQRIDGIGLSIVRAEPPATTGAG